MDKQLLKGLLQKFESGECSEEEIILLENWYLQWNPNEEVKFSEYLVENSVDNIWRRLDTNINTKPVINLWPRVAAAIAIIMMLGAGAYFYLGKNKELSQTEIAAIQAGGNKAILTLANGSKITLADEPNGAVLKQAGVTIVKGADGQISYTSDAQTGSSNIAIEYNSITTPRGGQYQLVLPDGSHVWLNAASSIRYPTVFTNHERKVEISGEAYFEVAKNAEQPFKVEINGNTEVKVLGTHFNINAYPNEPVIQTTLAEGAISIHSGALADKLAPGQQVNIGYSPTGKLYLNKVEGANLDQVLAWKDGLFSFQGVPFEMAMRQLSRWYDVDVIYENGVPDIKFGGELGRDVNFSKILFFLSKVNVHYRVEQGKRLVITK